MLAKVTRLDGKTVYLNTLNIQWVESLPDSTITLIGGARVIVKESLEEVLKIIEESVAKTKV